MGMGTYSGTHDYGKNVANAEERSRRWQVDRYFSPDDILDACNAGKDNATYYPVIIKGIHTSIRDLGEGGWSVRVRSKIRYSTGTKVTFYKDGCTISVRVHPRLCDQDLYEIFSYLSCHGFQKGKSNPVVVKDIHLAEDRRKEAAVVLVEDAKGHITDEYRFTHPITKEMEEEFTRMHTLGDDYRSATHQPLLEEYTEMQLLQELERRANARPKAKRRRVEPVLPPDNVVHLKERMKTILGDNYGEREQDYDLAHASTGGA